MTTAYQFSHKRVLKYTNIHHKQPLGMSMYIWEDNIKMELTDMGCKDVD